MSKLSDAVRDSLRVACAIAGYGDMRHKSLLELAALIDERGLPSRAEREALKAARAGEDTSVSDDRRT